MRIATLSNAAVVHTRRWVETLRARGHEVEVWSLEPPPPDFATHALPAWPLPGFARYPLAAAPLARALEQWAPDVVDAHFVPNYGMLGALVNRHPLAVTAWGSDLLITGARDALQRARARFVLRRADAVIADSDNLAAAARTLGAPPERVHAIPWGVDRGRFSPASARMSGLIASTRLHERIYDLDTVIDGVAPLFAGRPHVRLVIAGDGRLRGALEARARRRLPAGRYEFTGRLAPDAMATLLARAEIFVSASHSDSTSVSLLEAMASGAVPVVSDLEGNREWVSEGAGARLFPVGSASGLTAALERAFAERAWLEAARQRNLRVIGERGDAALNFIRIESVFANLVRARPRGES